MENEHPGKCLKCGHYHINKYGTNPDGKQRWVCVSCKRVFVIAKQSYNDAFREQVLHAVREGMSQRVACRVFGIARMTLSTWFKKSR